MIRPALDAASPVPPFEQIRTQLAGAIESGELVAGTRMPTVRQLAADMGLAVNTVARVYRELEMAGYVETLGRNGTFVATSTTDAGRHAASAARQYIRKARSVGLGDGEIEAILRRELSR